MQVKSVQLLRQIKSNIAGVYVSSLPLSAHVKQTSSAVSVLYDFFLQSSCFWNARRLPVLSIFLLEGDSGGICFQLQPGLYWPLIRVWADRGRGETLS